MSYRNWEQNSGYLRLKRESDGGGGGQLVCPQ
jgi:hypothetical protein